MANSSTPWCEPAVDNDTDSIAATLFSQMVYEVAKAAMEGLVKIIGALLPIIPPLVDAGAKIMAALGPSLATLIDALEVLAIPASMVQHASRWHAEAEAVGDEGGGSGTEEGVEDRVALN